MGICKLATRYKTFSTTVTSVERWPKEISLLICSDDPIMKDVGVPAPQSILTLNER